MEAQVARMLKDPRANTIPGTEDDLDESMLLAPLIFEERVLGVIVLSKLGLHQFSPDDLRLLEIYASLAAQAMANADATEQHERDHERAPRLGVHVGEEGEQAEHRAEAVEMGRASCVAVSPRSTATLMRAAASAVMRPSWPRSSSRCASKPAEMNTI